jgi:hypothetical protein
MQGLRTEALLRIIDDHRAKEDIRRYFGVGTGPTGPGFTGRRFERLGGGGDRDGVQNRITAEDLVAVEMLSVQVPPPVALDILEGELGIELSTQLCSIPIDIALGTPEARHLVEDGSAAERTWRALKNCDGVGWVTAGKLLARKRPRLVPVYDTVMRCACQRPDNFWLWLDDRLSEDEGKLLHSLRELRKRAAVPIEVSDLRVFDVAIWMRHRPEHVLRRCPGVIQT